MSHHVNVHLSDILANLIALSDLIKPCNLSDILAKLIMLDVI